MQEQKECQWQAPQCVEIMTAMTFGGGVATPETDNGFLS